MNLFPATAAKETAVLVAVAALMVPALVTVPLPR